MKFSLDEAIEFSKKGFLEEWVHKFLENKGNNIHLSKRMKNKGYWLGIVEFPLGKLVRCCGPEENMKFRENSKSWEESINKIRLDIKKGWKAPPLIVWYLDGIFSIADGNHRFEALKRLNYKKYWIIIWFEKQIDFEKFKKNRTI